MISADDSNKIKLSLEGRRFKKEFMENRVWFTHYPLKMGQTIRNRERLHSMSNNRSLFSIKRHSLSLSRAPFPFTHSQQHNKLIVRYSPIRDRRPLWISHKCFHRCFAYLRQGSFQSLSL